MRLETQGRAKSVGRLNWFLFFFLFFLSLFATISNRHEQPREGARGSEPSYVVWLPVKRPDLTSSGCDLQHTKPDRERGGGRGEEEEEEGGYVKP